MRFQKPRKNLQTYKLTATTGDPFDAIIGFIDDPGLGDEWLKGKHLLLAGGSRVSLDLLLPPIPFDESAGGVVQVGASTDCLS